MDDIQRQQIVTQARDFWERDFPLKAGMLIFERIPLERRADWAANILDFVYQHFEPIPEVDAVVEFARRPELWPKHRYREAHGLFDAVRIRSSQRSPKEPLDEDISRLAENTAGIAYTARQYPAPFDHNRGWWIAADLRGFIKNFRLDEIAAWQTLADGRFIQLDSPVVCNPGCPICQPPQWDYLTEVK